MIKKLTSYLAFVWRSGNHEQSPVSWRSRIKQLVVGWLGLLVCIFTLIVGLEPYNVIDYGGLLFNAILAAMIFTLLGLFISLIVAAFFVIFLPPLPAIRTPTKKDMRRKALYDVVTKAGGKEIHVKRIGTEGTYLEHFLVHYYDSQDSWQVRHIIRNQMKERYYWDDPVIKYEREVSAKISQAKQNLINNLDVEIHELRLAVAAQSDTK